MYERLLNPSIEKLAAGVLVALLAGCATVSTAATPPGFEGSWHVPWCDASRPGTDCGGFSVTLIEREGRLCGTYDGARVGLTQIDEGRGNAIKGIRIGNSAVVTLKSARSGDIYLVRAELQGDRLAWKVIDDVHDAEGDVDVVATDDTLQRAPQRDAAQQREVAEACPG